MHKKSILIQTEKFVRNELSQADSGHSFWHIQRVVKNAKKIAKTLPQADIFVVEMGALLHDVGDIKITGGEEELGVKLVRDFLQTLKISQNHIEHICNIVENISFRKSKEKGKKFSSLELQIVQDADKIESIGAIGIARAFMFGGAKNRTIYDPKVSPNLNKTKREYIQRTGTTIDHFYEKLLLLKDMLHTKEARKMAQERHKFMLLFLKQFISEWEEK